MTSFFALGGLSFLFIRVINFLVTFDLIFLLKPNFTFTLVVFVHMLHFNFDFVFFLILSDFFRNGYHSSLIVPARSSFLFSQ